MRIEHHRLTGDEAGTVRQEPLPNHRGTITPELLVMHYKLTARHVRAAQRQLQLAQVG